MAHGGARACPGAAGPALVVASTPKQLHVMEKAKRELRMEEGNGAVLATVRSPARPWRMVSERSQRPYPRAKGPAKRWRRSRGTLRSYDEDVARVFLAALEFGDGEQERRWRSGCLRLRLLWRAEN